MCLCSYCLSIGMVVAVQEVKNMPQFAVCPLCASSHTHED